jgi:hypothetical protein
MNLSFLDGREVEHVAIGVYQAQFYFDEDVIIRVESEFSYFDGKEKMVWRPEPGSARGAARTVGLLFTVRFLCGSSVICAARFSFLPQLSTIPVRNSPFPVLQ